MFSLEQVNCVGACALGPLAIVDGVYQGNMTPDKLSKKLRKLQRKKGKKG
jgi:NADH:ubiquinone oxidoreductase subunit E